MKNKIAISAVSYLNTKPFLYGLYAKGLDKYAHITLDTPANCALKLKESTVQLGLVPVAVIPHIQNAQVLSDFCIGTEAAVKTVGIYSCCPIHQISHLMLDYQSKTSVALSKYLLRHYWKINPILVDAKSGYESSISGKKAALIIGDRTIGIESKYPYFYDLGAAWYQHTQQPFVFAAWVSNCQLPDAFVQQFNAALRYGVEQRANVAALFQSAYPDFDVQAYYHKYISYQLNAPKRKALSFFLDKVAGQQLTR